MVGIYCRISGNKEDDKDTSEETQIEKGVKFAIGLSMPHTVYKDIGISGTTGAEKREDFKRLLKDMREGKITHVYALNQSRLERNPDVWRIFSATVVKYNIKWYPSGLLFDLNNSSNKMMAGMLSLINEFHATNTSDAVIDAFNKMAEQGKGHGVKAYGIDYDDDGYMYHHVDEIKIVKDIFKLSLSGMGVYSIANKLNDDKIPTRYVKLDKPRVLKDDYTGKTYAGSNKKWWGSTISGILKNESFKGIYVWGEKRVSLPHLAILTEEEFDAVQRNFATNKIKSVGKNNTYQYLLNGLMFCTECGSRMRGVIKKKSRDNSYKCVGKTAPNHLCKGSRGVNIPRLETFILKHLFINKDLQEHLNAIEVDTDEVDLMKLKVSQIEKKVKSQSKKVTKTRNAMYDDDFADDVDVKNDYISAKNKLAKLKDEFIELNDALSEQIDNNRLTRFNSTIEGFDMGVGFEAIKRSVHNVLERIDVTYTPLEKNGRFTFKIKYKGFDETTSYLTNKQLMNFICTSEMKDGIIKDYDSIFHEHRLSGSITLAQIPHGNWKRGDDLKDYDWTYSDFTLDVFLKKEELVKFNTISQLN